jgi:hypothetical protein
VMLGLDMKSGTCGPPGHAGRSVCKCGRLKPGDSELCVVCLEKLIYRREAQLYASEICAALDRERRKARKRYPGQRIRGIPRGSSWIIRPRRPRRCNICGAISGNHGLCGPCNAKKLEFIGESETEIDLSNFWMQFTEYHDWARHEVDRIFDISEEKHGFLF